MKTTSIFRAREKYKHQQYLLIDQEREEMGWGWTCVLCRAGVPGGNIFADAHHELLSKAEMPGRKNWATVKRMILTEWLAQHCTNRREAYHKNNVWLLVEYTLLHKVFENSKMAHGRMKVDVEFMTIEATMQELGICRRTVFNLIRRGRLTRLKAPVGRKRTFFSADQVCALKKPTPFDPSEHSDEEIRQMNKEFDQVTREGLEQQLRELEQHPSNSG